MNEKITGLLKSRLSIDKEAAKNGKWLQLGPGIELLCRPATIHNMDYQKKVIAHPHFKFSDIVNNPEKAEDHETQRQFAEIITGTLILAIRDQTDHEVTEELNNPEDVLELISDYTEYFNLLLLRLANPATFAPITEEQSKN